MYAYFSARATYWSASTRLAKIAAECRAPRAEDKRPDDVATTSNDRVRTAKSLCGSSG